LREARHFQKRIIEQVIGVRCCIIGNIMLQDLTLFYFSNVDSSTVRFGVSGTGVAPSHYALEDVDGDGDIDMILHFSTESKR
jgi:hypothetical protein